MEQFKDSIASNITARIYSDTNKEYVPTYRSVKFFLDVLIWNLSLFLGYYCFSTSLSILSLCLSFGAGFLIHNQTRALYVDIRVSNGGTVEQAQNEFSKLFSHTYKSALKFMVDSYYQLHTTAATVVSDSGKKTTTT